MSPWDLDWTFLHSSMRWLWNSCNNNRKIRNIKRKGKKGKWTECFSLFFYCAGSVLTDEITWVVISNTCMTGQVIYTGNTTSRRISDKWLQEESSPATKWGRVMLKWLSIFRQRYVCVCLMNLLQWYYLQLTNCYLMFMFDSFLRPSKGAHLTFLRALSSWPIPQSRQGIIIVDILQTVHWARYYYEMPKNSIPGLAWRALVCAEE